MSNDADNRAKAGEMGVVAMSVAQYAASRPDAPELRDLVAPHRGEEEDGVTGMDEDKPAGG